MSEENQVMESRDGEGSSLSEGGRQDRGMGGRGLRRSFYKRKFCKICKGGVKVGYKKPDTLRRFITERGKILPRRITGTCAKHQRLVTTEVKRARSLALLPYVTK